MIFYMGFIDLLNELRKRYEECGSQGHLKPNSETDFCYYCYRHLKYHQLENKDIPQSERKKRKYIRMQMRIDYFNGLEKLTKELSQ